MSEREPAATVSYESPDEIHRFAAPAAKVAWKPTRRQRLRQVRTWLRYRRWRRRCEECGGMFLPGHSVHSFGNRDGKQWHDKCMGYVTFRRQCEEQLVVLDLITDVWGITMGDVTSLMEGRAEREGYETANAYNLGWRVMYSIDQRREAAAKQAASDA